jgi:hypothetical protein
MAATSAVLTTAITMKDTQSSRFDCVGILVEENNSIHRYYQEAPIEEG